MKRGKRPGRLPKPSAIEQQIRDAMARGEFDDLPGRGKPFENLGEADDPTWWARQLLRREGLSVVPPAIEIRRKVERELAQLPQRRDEREVRERVRVLNEVIAKLNGTVTSGPATTLGVLDEDELVESWRAARGEDAPT